jgi:hypothetical protein
MLLGASNDQSVECVSIRDKPPPANLCNERKNETDFKNTLIHSISYNMVNNHSHTGYFVDKRFRIVQSLDHWILFYENSR